MRRKPGALLPLEVEILGVAAAAGRDAELHGFAIARDLRDANGSRSLTGHGTLYKALGRLEGAGMLESWWEDPDDALAEGRPRRRLYRITGNGRAALARATAAAPHPRPGIAPA